MERPKVKIQLDKTDVLIETINKLGILILIFLPIYYYNDLPEQIPTHYNATGQVDGFSGRASIFVLPVIGLFLNAGMNWLNKVPHIFNYSVNITKENAKTQYTLATKLIRFLNLGIVLTFTYICYKSIQISLNKQEGLSPWFLPLFLLIFVLVPVYFTIKMYKKN
jgi:uncharacterized membrane protein